MRSVAIILVGFLLLALESPLLYDAGMAQYVPDLVLVMTVYLGLTSSFGRGLGIGRDGAVGHDRRAVAPRIAARRPQRADQPQAQQVLLRHADPHRLFGRLPDPTGTSQPRVCDKSGAPGPQ